MCFIQRSPGKHEQSDSELYTKCLQSLSLQAADSTTEMFPLFRFLFFSPFRRKVIGDHYLNQNDGISASIQKHVERPQGPSGVTSSSMIQVTIPYRFVCLMNLFTQTPCASLGQNSPELFSLCSHPCRVFHALVWCLTFLHTDKP